MAYDILLEREGQILRVRYSGQVGIEERRAAAEAVFGQATHAGITRFLLDYRGSIHIAGNADSSVALARYLAHKLGDRNAKVAWLVNYDHQLGSSVENLAGDFGIANRRFYDFDAAMAWLAQADHEPDVIGPDVIESEVIGAPAATPSPPRRALALAMEASDPQAYVPPLQFAAIAKLVQELLDEGMDEAKVLRLTRRMFDVVYGGRARPAPSSSGRG